MKSNKLPPIEELRRLFSYDPETGILMWKVSMGSRARAGNEAGYSNTEGYKYVRITRKEFAAHRICYAIYHGVDPHPMQVDHINHDRLDNRIENLRLVSNQENHKNRSKSPRNTSGVTGVCWHKKANKWRAQIQLNGKQKYLGCFTNKADAIAARRAAEKQYGYHENHGDWEDLKNDIGQLNIIPIEEEVDIA